MKWTIFDLLLSPGVWDINLLSSFFYYLIVNTIKTIHVNPLVDQANELVWGLSRSGSFFVSSTYLLISKMINEDKNPLENSFNGSWIWKIPIPPKNQILISLLIHESIQTGSILKSHGVSTSPICQLCKSVEESPIHLFCDYSLSKVV